MWEGQWAERNTGTAGKWTLALDIADTNGCMCASKHTATDLPLCDELRLQVLDVLGKLGVGGCAAAKRRAGALAKTFVAALIASVVVAASAATNGSQVRGPAAAVALAACTAGTGAHGLVLSVAVSAAVATRVRRCEQRGQLRVSNSATGARAREHGTQAALHGRELRLALGERAPLGGEQEARVALGVARARKGRLRGGMLARLLLAGAHELDVQLCEEVTGGVRAKKEGRAVGGSPGRGAGRGAGRDAVRRSARRSLAEEAGGTCARHNPAPRNATPRLRRTMARHAPRCCSG